MGDTTHDYCRAHAFCNRQGQYFRSFCADCENLWDRARDVEGDPELAASYWIVLKKWIVGFRKNSRDRAPGQHFFYDRDEYSEFLSLNKRHAILMEGDYQGFYSEKPPSVVS